MKKIVIVILIVLCCIATAPVRSHAGNFMVGWKYWYAWWDSAVLDWFAKDVAVGFASLGVDLQSNVDTGTGYLTGPLLGYQTESGTWSFSFAGMFISDFDQDYSGSSGSMALTSHIDTDRQDYDFAAIYSLAGHKDKWSFFEYCRIFFGYKYQRINYDLVLSYDTLMGTRQFPYKLDSSVHMPTVGAGIVYPFSEKFAFGLQGGIGLALTDLEMTDSEGDTFDISPDASITYNGEINLNFVPIKKLIIQLGFRAQIWYLKARSPQRWAETESTDKTYGPTISVVYRF